MKQKHLSSSTDEYVELYEIDENTSTNYEVFDNSPQVYDSNGNLLTKAY